MLHFTRTWTDHDRRFVQAYRERGAETAVVILRTTTAGIRGDIEDLGVARVASLDLEPPFSQSQLEATVADYRRLEASYAPEVVMAGPLTDCAFIKAAAATRVPWIAQSWAFDVFWEPDRSPEARSRVEHVLQVCEALFADCQAVAARCADLGYRTSQPLLVVPWGLERAWTIDVPARSRSRSALGVEGKQVFVHTRGFEPIHDPLALIAAWKGAAAVPPARHLLLLGDGLLRREMAEAVEQHGLADSVTLAGRVSRQEMERVMRAADFYVSSSRCDGTSVSLLEAMGAGLPPIVTNLGGNPEWVSHENNGWMVPPGAPEELGAAIVQAGRLDHARRLEIAETNARLIAIRANWTQNADRLLAFIRRVRG
ncbi:MAG TPA: glycosyltransferase family 4 protein [Opitutaceae bacterium]|nr:glycosyltransferase family 4 protein [Lacunisphaera sp.]HWA09185.1 glycosyltransferase family 4 protein [Opitutaceae bacterium]